MPTLDQQLDKFEKDGPFTFDRAFALVKLCAKSKDTDFHDVLDNILYKFPPEELEKILHFSGDAIGPGVHIWEKGCSYGRSFTNYNGQFTAEQLKVIAKSQLELTMDYAEMDAEDRLAVLVAHNRHLAKQRAAKRDKSPSRK